MTEPSREEHLQQCKDTALEYVKLGQMANAYASFLSDMHKHPETRNHVALDLGVLLLAFGHLDDAYSMTQFIVGFR